jgi:hypothetical protein
MRLYEQLARVTKFDEAHQLLLDLYAKSVQAKTGFFRCREGACMKISPGGHDVLQYLEEQILG